MNACSYEKAQGRVKNTIKFYSILKEENKTKRYK